MQGRTSSNPSEVLRENVGSQFLSLRQLSLVEQFSAPSGAARSSTRDLAALPFGQFSRAGLATKTSHM